MPIKFNPEQIQQFKLQARIHSRSSGSSRTSELDQIANQHGFESWALLMKHAGPETQTNASSLDQFADIVRGNEFATYFSPAPTKCDMCRKDLSDEKYFVDAVIRNSTTWACMCEKCFNELGAGIAWGEGQLYQNQRNSRWLMVGGFPPIAP
ncbi:hypothetical protein [Massilia sp. YIM B04103]|uniref:hypothetical protein n=1 Tax=Massilia sp. YIM B04103 TaxID=2963106 RepID=UPI002109385D|nr:hypothetical protein [Massilia sp. YIM B04103]